MGRCVGGFVLGALLMTPWSAARADCGPQGVDIHGGPGVAQGDAVAVVPPDPTLYAFWRRSLAPAFDVVCERDGEALAFVLHELPTATGSRAGQLSVTTGDCTAFVVRNADPSARWSYRPDGGAAHFTVRDAPAPSERPAPMVASARRVNQEFGCGPSSHLALTAYAQPAAMRIEVQPGEHAVVVPTYPGRAEQGGHPLSEFWVGRTMCMGPNLPEAALGGAMQVRLTALYADGSEEVGAWQTVAPPPGIEATRHGVAWDVGDRPLPPLRDSALSSEAAVQAADAAPCRGAPGLAWLWLLLAVPGAFATARALRRDGA